MITKVFIVPPSVHYNSDRIFDRYSTLNRDGSLEPFINLRKLLNRANVRVHTIDMARVEDFDSQCVILFIGSTLELTYQYLNYKCRSRFFFFLEPYLVKPTIYKNFYKFADKFKGVFIAEAYRNYIPKGTSVKALNWPYQNRFDNYQKIVKVNSSRCRKCLLIIGPHVGPARKNNGYGLRFLVLTQSLYRDFFVVRGAGWRWFPRIRCWPNGAMVLRYFKIKLQYQPVSVEDKIHEMTKYDFSLVIENEFGSGMHTEKLFDALLAGSIPIYKGDPRIVELIPRECLILSDDFKSIDEALEICLTMSEEEIRRRRKSIVEFVCSQRFQRICDAFIFDVISCVD